MVRVPPQGTMGLTHEGILQLNITTGTAAEKITIAKEGKYPPGLGIFARFLQTNFGHPGAFFEGYLLAVATLGKVSLTFFRGRRGFAGTGSHGKLGQKQSNFRPIQW